MAGFGKKNEKKKNKPQLRAQSAGEAIQKKALNYQIKGDLINAEKAYREAIKTGYIDNSVFSNLGIICKNSGRFKEATILYRKAIESNPNHPDAYTNLGNLHRELVSFDQALASTLKSLELKPDSPGAMKNLKEFVEKQTLSSANASNLRKAYELLINLDNISHKKLSRVFIQAFLPTIQEAAKLDPIITVDNNALNNLAADWRLKKSLTLLIPPHKDIEHFLTRLRKELLI